MSQEIDNVFDSLELSEETVAKIKTIFEAAVNCEVQRIEQEINEKTEAFYAERAEAYGEYLKEEYETHGNALVEQFNQKVEEVEAQSIKTVEEAVQEWISENTVQVANQMKLQRMESFVGGLRSLFVENGIDIPDAEYSIAEDLSKQVAEMQESASALEGKLEAISEELASAKKTIAFAQVTEGMTVLDIEKLTALVEEKEGETVEDFTKRVETLKEAFVEKKASVEEVSKQVNEAEKKGTTTNKLSEDVLNALKGRF